MTLTRLSLLALAFCGLNLIACGDKDTGDTAPEGDTDADSDADTDTDTDADTDTNYFIPYVWDFSFETGFIGGEAVDVDYSGHALPPTFYIELAEKEFFDAYDERYTCMMAFEPTVSAGSVDAEAWMDLTLVLDVAYYSDCDNLDPAVFGADPTEYFGGVSWELTAAEMEQAAVDSFVEQIGEDKWEEGYADFVFGGDAWLEGDELDATDTDQVMWGVAFELDGTSMDADAELLENTDIAMGVDGFYRFLPMYYWGFSG